MSNYSIGITTFSKRLVDVVKLVNQIRKLSNKTIIISINGEKDGNFDENYRLDILKLCQKYNGVYPLFNIEIRGLSKLWNNIIITSCDDNVLMLNDDIEILNNDIFNKTETHINSSNFTGLTKMNSSFSHFIVNKKVIDLIGYFDERLLGFGEEDGDITYRLLKNGINVNNIMVDGLVNIVSNVRHDSVVPGIGKYSKFNRDFIYNQKYRPDINSPLKGLFDTPMKQKLDDLSLYPYERFFIENKGQL